MPTNQEAAIQTPNGLLKLNNSNSLLSRALEVRGRPLLLLPMDLCLLHLLLRQRWCLDPLMRLLLRRLLINLLLLLPQLHPPLHPSSQLFLQMRNPLARLELLAPRYLKL